jgi:hypothetical protein
MNEKRTTPTLTAVLAALLVFSVLAPPTAGRAAESAVYTGHYNLLGYEGIPTLGSGLMSNGEAPPAGDYVTTHCRYINVQNTTVGHYYLRYALDLPGGSNITMVRFHVADFNPSGVLWAYLRSRQWNSRNSGTTLGFTLTDNTTNSDKTITLDFSSNPINVNNQTHEYWIDVSPQNSANPGQLCVYGIQVTYTIDGLFLPLIQRGG